MSTQTVTELPPATEETMETLFAIRYADELLLDGEAGRITVVKDGEEYEVPDDPFDDLMRRKWVVSHDELNIVEVTEKGIYWLKKWARKHRTKRGPKIRPCIRRRPHR